MTEEIEPFLDVEVLEKVDEFVNEEIDSPE